MKIDLIISADDIKKQKIIDRSVVVIDMLRATSVITTALSNGCAKVIPVVTVEEALEIAKADRKNTVLGGERKALKIEGFDLSNSPLEYTQDIVQNKAIVMTTTNGTKAIKGCEGARDILIGALINGGAVARKLIELNNDVVFVNAGTHGEFSIDDFICTGYIIDCMLKYLQEDRAKVGDMDLKKAMGDGPLLESRKTASGGNDLETAVLSDIAFTAHYIYENNTNIFDYIQNASHYKRIQQLELFSDLEYCCRKDITKVVGRYADGHITK